MCARAGTPSSQSPPSDAADQQTLDGWDGLDWVGCGWVGCDWEEAEWEGWLPCRSIDVVVGRSGTRAAAAAATLLLFLFLPHARDWLPWRRRLKGAAWRGVRGVRGAATAAIHGICCFFCFSSNNVENAGGKGREVSSAAASCKRKIWVGSQMGCNRDRAECLGLFFGSWVLGLGSLPANCPGSSTPCTRYSRLQMIDGRL